MTGAPVPEGADAVVMVEHVERDGTTVRIAQSARPGQFINVRAAEAQKGQCWFLPGRVLMQVT